MDRRTFLGSSAAALGLGGSATTLGLAGTTRPALASTASPILEARPGKAQLLPEGYAETEIWGFDGSVPGPLLRLRQGEELRRSLKNGLSQATSVHWHGIRLPNAMDGVPGLTQEAVPPGEGFNYAFTPPDAGSYWYHSHNRSLEQVARGLYGVLIVDEREAPDLDQDIVLAIDDWRIDPERAQLVGDFDNMHDLSHAGRLGNLVTVNGAYEFSQEVKRNQRLRLRLLNVANSRIFTLGLRGAEGWIMALDGMPLAAPQSLDGPLLLAPGQRADVFVDVTAETGGEVTLVGFEQQEGFALASLAVTAGAGETRRAAPGPLPANPVADPAGYAEAPVHRLVMQGGAMRGLGTTLHEGAQKSMPELMQAGQFWAFNGVAGLPEAPLLSARRGEVQRVRMVNETIFPHAMHLHGHHFREVLADGLGPFRDTLLLDASEEREIAFVADNPGDWLLHCHMLAHQAAGMKTWLRVSA